jgi:hypothetical protein
MGRVVIGMDPHKRSATIEVLDGRERVLQVGRFGTDRHGYRDMLGAGRRWPDRVWAIEGCNGVGRHLAQRLVADGEPGGGCAGEAVGAGPGVRHRARAQDRRHRRALGRGGGAADPGLRGVEVDDATVALRLLVDRRDGLGAARTATVNRLHRLLVELVPGGRRSSCPSGRPEQCWRLSARGMWRAGRAGSSPRS